MKTFHVLPVATLCATMLLMGCATIVSRSTYPLAIRTEPEDAEVSVHNKAGIEVFRGSSPAVVDLKAGAGYFAKEAYVVTIRKDGYQDRVVPVNFTLNEWYLGNIVFGGLIGMLIVDPASGAMWRIESSFIKTTLKEIPSSGSVFLNVYDLAAMPEEWRDHLVRIK